ncbi:hypothetical protein [Halorubrum sp. Boch-26]|uniref:hypothetical protein n=1 Tax=Halorubrum sp. Boch-26 TaxID=2994426 RepID=UPI00246953F0|nr:hypothetical protein [Halorubrum sp. Boch-26]
MGFPAEIGEFSPDSLGLCDGIDGLFDITESFVEPASRVNKLVEKRFDLIELVVDPRFELVVGRFDFSNALLELRDAALEFGIGLVRTGVKILNSTVQPRDVIGEPISELLLASALLFDVEREIPDLPTEFRHRPDEIHLTP